MRNPKKITFRPFLEAVEPRIVATAGVVAAVHQPAHLVVHPPKVVSAESHHPVHQSEQKGAIPSTHHSQTANAGYAVHSSNASQAPRTPVVPPTSSLQTNTTTNQAWVELVNMTGRALEYQVKLSPYANGQPLVFDIAAGASQYRMSSLITNGQRVVPDFSIQFGNGPVTPLVTGISQQTAQGYYIFQGTDAQYFVVPFFTMPGPF